MREFVSLSCPRQGFDTNASDDGVALLKVVGRAHAVVRRTLTRLGGQLFVAATGVLRRPSARPIVATVSHAHAWLYRVTGGRAAIARYPTLLLTVRGRRSGELRTVPLVYVRDGSAYAVCAAYSGSDTYPAWWLNLRGAMTASIQVGPDNIGPRTSSLVRTGQVDSDWTCLSLTMGTTRAAVRE
jgi:deazaflavin-dependent oxidoreductase (nitroreductase family)